MAVRKVVKKRRTVRRVVRRKTVKRNPQKTFRARGKVVSFFAKRNPAHGLPAGTKVLTYESSRDKHSHTVPAVLGKLDKTTPLYLLRSKKAFPIHGYVWRSRDEFTVVSEPKANPRKRTVKRVRRNPLPPRNPETGRFMKTRANPRKRR